MEHIRQFTTGVILQREPLFTVKRRGRIRLGIAAYTVMALACASSFYGGMKYDRRSQDPELTWCLAASDFIHLKQVKAPALPPVKEVKK
jgi:hypothetical protein